MFDKKVYQLLNEQVMKELYSSYLYLHMADYFADEGLEGFQNWFEVQAKEELDHALLFRKYILNNGEPVKLLPIEAPDMEFSDFCHPLKKALEHERIVTGLINAIYAAASEANDFRTTEFLNWFIKEQGEEEKNTSDLIKKYELFGRDSKGLYDLDKELMARVYSAPSLILD